MELQDICFPGGNTFFNGHLPKDVHHPRDIDLIGTTVMQVSQDRHSQMVELESTCSFCPFWIIFITLLGLNSM